MPVKCMTSMEFPTTGTLPLGIQTRSSSMTRAARSTSARSCSGTQGIPSTTTCESREKKHRELRQNYQSNTCNSFQWHWQFHSGGLKWPNDLDLPGKWQPGGPCQLWWLRCSCWRVCHWDAVIPIHQAHSSHPLQCFRIWTHVHVCDSLVSSLAWHKHWFLQPYVLFAQIKTDFPFCITAISFSKICILYMNNSTWIPT